MIETDFFPELPSTWSKVPLKSVCYYVVSNVDKHSLEGEKPVRLCNYTDVYKNEKVSPNLDLMVATASEEEIRRFRLEAGDVVITKDSESWDDIGIPAFVEASSDDFVCAYHLAFARSKTEALLGEYLFRCMQSRPVAIQLELAATGVTRYGVPKGAIGSAILPLPPIECQAEVVAYLDREVERIDTLIAEKERMLMLLEEKRAALISEAVTGGLNPDVPRKSSGSDWLRDIPAHWQMIRAKGLFREIDRRTTSGEEELLSLRMNVGLVPHNHVSDKELGPSDLIGFKIVEPGQMVINRMRAASGLIAVSERFGLVSPDYAVFEVVKTDMNIDYMLALFTTSLVQAVFRSSSKGLGTGSSGFLRLYSDNFLALHFPFPSIEEQKKIVEFLVEENDQVAQISSALKASVALLRERRAALITAAVTGQIDPKDMVA